MREGLIVCPQHDNDGKPLGHVHHYAELALCKAFGGCTSVRANGAWINGDGKLVAEPVWQLIAAYEPSADNDAKLASVARYIGREGAQEAVYCRYASGDVHIIDTKAAGALAA